MACRDRTREQVSLPRLAPPDGARHQMQQQRETDKDDGDGDGDGDDEGRRRIMHINELV